MCDYPAYQFSSVFLYSQIFYSLFEIVYLLKTNNNCSENQKFKR